MISQMSGQLWSVSVAEYCWPIRIRYSRAIFQSLKNTTQKRLVKWFG